MKKYVITELISEFDKNPDKYKDLSVSELITQFKEKVKTDKEKHDKEILDLQNRFKNTYVKFNDPTFDTLNVIHIHELVYEGKCSDWNNIYSIIGTRIGIDNFSLNISISSKINKKINKTFAESLVLNFTIITESEYNEYFNKANEIKKMIKSLKN